MMHTMCKTNSHANCECITTKRKQNIIHSWFSINIELVVKHTKIKRKIHIFCCHFSTVTFFFYFLIPSFQMCSIFACISYIFTWISCYFMFDEAMNFETWFFHEHSVFGNRESSSFFFCFFFIFFFCWSSVKLKSIVIWFP